MEVTVDSFVQENVLEILQRLVSRVANEKEVYRACESKRSIGDVGKGHFVYPTLVSKSSDSDFYASVGIWEVKFIL